MILAITQRYEKYDKETYFKESFYLNKYFKDIFEKLNVLLFPIASNTQLETVVNLCDGLILTGSSIDINPKYYGEQIKGAKNLDWYNSQDEFDFSLIKSFNKVHKPILGICAGIQSINVCFGGSLYQDIPEHSTKEFLNMHSINIQKNSFLEKCYKTNKIEVNSFHHQAINKVAQNLKLQQQVMMEL